MMMPVPLQISFAGRDIPPSLTQIGRQNWQRVSHFSDDGRIFWTAELSAAWMKQAADSFGEQQGWTEPNCE